MEILEDRWLASIFGHGVFRIETGGREGIEESEPAGLDEEIQAHARRQTAALYYARVDTRRVATVRRLGLAGLYVVEGSVLLGRSGGSSSNFAGAGTYPVAEISPGQHREVLEIAASCFQYSRFHLDPWVPNEIANQIKRGWVQSYLRQERGERLWVATVDGRPAGFLAVLTSESDGERLATIDLMGVGRAFQRLGVGKALVRFFIGEYQNRCDRLQVGTQAANLPSLGLYESLGFSIVKTQYAMHMHVRDGVNPARPHEDR
ncbi:MAG TPA: GNAT family N-acetyltransferase [Candidatus Binatia bacterium]